MAIAVMLLALSACAADPVPAGPAPGPAASTPAPTPPPPPDPIAHLTLEQRVGQLFLVGTPVEGVDPRTRSALVDAQAGGAFLHGRSSAGVAVTAAFVAALTTDAPGAPWVAADQEGGYVQALKGEGFDEIPAATAQAALGAGRLRAAAGGWGAQLRRAGVTMNLAPVADIVTSPESAVRNEPIGAIDRQYGYDLDSVATLAGAFADGMRDAGVVPVFKHFPGLGRTEQNTDYSDAVVDTAVGADSPDVAVYRALLRAGPAVVMMSLAEYERIDPGVPAVFSPVVVDGLLRDRIGFDGVVMTDDLSATAQVGAWSPAERGVLALQAGVDVLLVSADPAVFADMYSGVLDRARTDPAFAERVDAAARRIIALKADPAFVR